MHLSTKIELLRHNWYFPSQEAIDRLATIKQKENQLEQLQEENARLREFEANFEDVQVRHRLSHSKFCLFLLFSFFFVSYLF